ncbi:Thioredoxin [hydrothermal vent metagenome]|uniref:Thioredoxin n=1 Tax=hydrothermal vent metagenome TaxID=652676 RepID=A0A3B0VGK5_9ZZZZ
MNKNITNATDDSFDADITADIPVLVDYWAQWCGPCRMIAPIIDEVATEMEGQIKVVKVDTETCQNTAVKMGVRGIPTLMVFKNGEVVDQHVGALSKGQLVEMLSKHTT